MTGNFFELGGEMSHTAVVHLVGDLCKVEVIIKEQFLDPFDLMFYKEFLDGLALCFRKNIGHVGIIMM